MSNINKQSQSLDKIAGVQDIAHESAAVCSGGALTVWSESNFQGSWRVYTSSAPDLSDFKNVPSSFEIDPYEVWRLWTGINYSGDYLNISGYYQGNLGFGFNNNIESAYRLQ